ncbi:hypothetical protein [Lachnoclostridium phytofermentans]|nr:hypothetical protein [Lachnoclostridium phytofermentans]
MAEENEFPDRISEIVEMKNIEKMANSTDYVYLILINSYKYNSSRRK